MKLSIPSYSLTHRTIVPHCLQFAELRLDLARNAQRTRLSPLPIRKLLNINRDIQHQVIPLLPALFPTCHAFFRLIRRFTLLNQNLACRTANNNGAPKPMRRRESLKNRTDQARPRQTSWQPSATITTESSTTIRRGLLFLAMRAPI